LGRYLGNLPLLPWYREVWLHPTLLAEAQKGFPFRGLVLVFPVLRGLLYWLRYSSLSLAGRMDVFDFTSTLGPGANRWLAPPLFGITQVLAWLTVAAALAANVWLFRRRAAFAAPAPTAPWRLWLRTYAALMLAATILVLCISPTTFMYWQGLALVHAAILPLVLWTGACWRSRWRRVAIAAVAAYAALELTLGLAMGYGSPEYRCRGQESVVFPLRSHSPMLEELNIQQTCPWPLDQPGGWWPDVLPTGGP
jgi:hypothetical protein